jgi:tellurite resistance protein TerC
MLLHDFFEIPEWASLAFIALSLFIGIIVSLKMNPEAVSEDKE